MTNEDKKLNGKTFKEWSKTEDAYLRQYCMVLSVEDMATSLKRGVDRVMWRMENVLGLTHFRRKRDKVDGRSTKVRGVNKERDFREGRRTPKGVADLEKFREYVKKGGLFSGD